MNDLAADRLIPVVKEGHLVLVEGIAHALVEAKN